MKNNTKNILISYENFNADSFINELMNSLTVNTSYSLLVKFGFEGNKLFYMSGPQIGIVLRDSHDINYYNNIFQIIEDRLEDIIVNYSLKSYPNNISLIIRVLTPLPDLIKNVKSLSLNKNIKKTEVNKLFNSRYLPLTIKRSNFGNLLEGGVKNKFIQKLRKVISLNNAKTPDILTNLDYNSKVFKYNKDNQELLIIDKELNLLNKLVPKDVYKRTVFDNKTGICLLEALDEQLDKNTFVRTIKDTSLTIQDNKVIELKRQFKFDKISYSKNKDTYKGMSNPNFGVLYLETYKDIDGLSKVFCIGYSTILDKNRVNSFYLSDYSPSLDSNLLIILCIDSLLIPKYNNFIFYIHNLGKFDVIFLYKVLKEFNLKKKQEYYKLNSIFRDDVMIKLTIKVKVSSRKFIKITLVDSLNILSFNLEKLAKDFKVNTLKGYFPYFFVNKTNLNYIGETPDIKFFNKISKVEYLEMYSKDNWNLKKEALEYLEKDLLSLLEVLKKFSSILFIHHNLQLTEGLTISR